jgi:nodulation protein A
MSAEALRWAVRWETELTPPDHKHIAELLDAAYSFDNSVLTGTQSWAGARPERRIVARRGDETVAHVGILRRFLQIADASVLVGEVGLVAVHPHSQRRGIGRELLRRLHGVLEDLQVPFGFFNCHANLLPFYTAGGWVHLPGVRTRYVDARFPFQPVTLQYPIVILPVGASVDDWPKGGLVVRNGSET